jgi:glycosyltransferase involved in cell wall biosynthesis
VTSGLVVYRANGGVDAIDQYARRLVRAMCEQGREARYVADGLPAARRRAAGAPWVLVQYNPFRYGRAGFAPRMLGQAAALRRAAGAPFAVMVHEAWIDMHDARSTAIGAYQRVQLKALLRLADVVLTSTQALAEQLGRRCAHVPVGSNIAPVAVTREQARARLGIGDGLVVALFGRSNPSRALDHAHAAVTALAREQPLTVLNLGADAPPLDVAGADVHTPGRLTADGISLRLRASDLLLLPLTDGVSTRRTTLMAGLAHGLPVLGLRGVNTDRLLLDLPLTPAGDPAAYALAAVALAADRRRREALGAQGQRLYATHFDWPVVARRVAAALER